MVPAMNMSENSIEEYTIKMRERYARMTGRKARSKLLDEFIEITAWDRKHANKVLLGARRRQGQKSLLQKKVCAAIAQSKSESSLPRSARRASIGDSAASRSPQGKRLARRNPRMQSKPSSRCVRRAGTPPRPAGPKWIPWPIAAVTWAEISFGPSPAWKYQALGPSCARCGIVGNTLHSRDLNRSGKVSRSIYWEWTATMAVSF